MSNLTQVPGYESLTTEQQAAFEVTLDRHMGAMGLRAREKLGEVKEVSWDPEDECIIVQFENDWYHYTPDGTWY